MAPFFFGRFVPSERGTIIEGEFRLHPFVKVFMVLWFTGLAVFGVITLLLPSEGQPAAFLVRASMFLGVCVMAAFGLGFVKFGGGLASGEKTVIVDFLKRTLEANEVA